MKKILLILLSLAMLFACDLGSDNSKKDDEKKEPEVVTPEETTLSAGRSILEDSNGNKIGEIAYTIDGFVILTPKNYLIGFNFEGSYWCKDANYSTGIDGTGDLYVKGLGYTYGYYKEIFEYQGTYYEYADRDPKGNPVPDTTVTLKCKMNWDGSFDNDTPIDNNGDFYKLVPRTMGELGLVENISLPIKLVSSIK